jgi:type VI secretion system protein ImpM
MNSEAPIGLYGKLPAYGDFIIRDLNPAFIDIWDEWLQHFISVSKEQIGNDWLNIYLTSPIWKFALSAGVIDDKMWAGIMMPSVDKVGRYFPISLIQSFAAAHNPVDFMASQQAWYDSIETQCLIALEGTIDADELMAKLSKIETISKEAYQATHNIGEAGPMVMGLSMNESGPMSMAMPYLLNAALNTHLSSYSVWHTHGSELISPMMFCTQGLPPIRGIASMLDGRWQSRNWKIPYNLKTAPEVTVTENTWDLGNE